MLQEENSAEFSTFFHPSTVAVEVLTSTAVLEPSKEAGAEVRGGLAHVFAIIFY